MTDEIRLAALMQIAAENFETASTREAALPNEPEPVRRETTDRPGMFTPDQQAMIMQMFNFVPGRLQSSTSRS
jgi:hypothetical protein